jgi:hypothetical protein
LAFVLFLQVNFGSHVGRCADLAVEELGFALQTLARAKVTNLYDTLIVEKHVLRLDVPMYNLFVVAEKDGLSNLLEEVRGQLLIQLLSPSDVGQQIAAHAQIEYKAEVIVGFE